MKTINSVIVTFRLAIPSLDFAEGGGDRTFERPEKAREVALAISKAEPEALVQEAFAQDKTTVEKQKHHC